MNIIRTETTMIPNTLDGKKLADEYEQKLREQCAFSGRREDTRYIIIDAAYYFPIEDGEQDDAIKPTSN